MNMSPLRSMGEKKSLEKWLRRAVVETVPFRICIWTEVTLVLPPGAKMGAFLGGTLSGQKYPWTVAGRSWR